MRFSRSQLRAAAVDAVWRPAVAYAFDDQLANWNARGQKKNVEAFRFYLPLPRIALRLLDLVTRDGCLPENLEALGQKLSKQMFWNEAVSF